MKKTTKNKSLILFDGYCLLCEWSVKFILKRDKKDSFIFTSLQSDIGKELLTKNSISTDYDKSVILIEKDILYFESDAALRISKKLRGLWPMLYLFILIPKSFRNWIYKRISKNRFKWFGKKKRCYLPTEKEKEKFL
ncbi:MAG: DUF393 domain-containing protein [Bacteroidales bacterium]|nr:DUF393 domain-containing protein [Bacteroidales bacterium]